MSAAPTYFFVHVMKTAGTTFVQHINANFARHERYPLQDRGVDRQRAYYMIDDLRTLPPAARQAVRVYAGHFPYVASRIVEADITLTMLRDPIERTISYLRHCKRYHPDKRDLPLEAIYEDGWQHPLYIRNYQAKLFAMTLDDKLESHLDVVEVDDARLAIAKDHLEQVDVLGLTEDYAGFVAEVQRRFGWHIGEARDLRVSTEDWDVPASFRRRIADDNAADLDFYDHARRVHDRRRAA